MSTATEMRSTEIQARMQSIRSKLPYAMDDAREQIQQLSDWKFYVRQMPLTSVACAAAVAFLAVPHPKPAPRHSKSKSDPNDEPATAKSSLVGGLVGAAASMAFRTGTNLALRKVRSAFLDSPSFSDSSKHGNQELPS